MKNKGVSLIVLIITIVVIIILAAAVILTINNNNPIGNSRVASVTQTRDSLQSGILVYTGNVAAKTLGDYTTSQILLGSTINTETYKIIEEGNTATITKNGNEVTLYKLDYAKVKKSLNLEVKDNGLGKWYIDEYGIVYLVYENIDNVLTYYKENNEILSSISDFVVVAGSVITSNENNNSGNSGSSQTVKQVGSITLSETSGVLTFSDTSKQITVTNPNNVTISATSSDETIATVSVDGNTVTVVLAEPNKAGDVTITITGAETDTYNAVSETYSLTTWSGSGAMPLSVAKATINSSNISSYIGTQVAYSPTGGGTWRIFYLDTANKYGDGANALFIIRDYDESLRYQMSSSSAPSTYSASDMVKFNKKWAEVDNNINANGEKHSAYLCTTSNWATYVNELQGARYAIGTPPVELYVDAYNQWHGVTYSLDYKFDNGAYGYNVGKNGVYNNDMPSGISVGPNNIFVATSSSDGYPRFHIASPYRGNQYHIIYIQGDSNYMMASNYNGNYRLRPVVCLGN